MVDEETPGREEQKNIVELDKTVIYLFIYIANCTTAEGMQSGSGELWNSLWGLFCFDSDLFVRLIVHV